MPSDTSVSIDAAPCRAFLIAVAWNGHAAHTTTGAAQPTSTHCQPGNLSHGNNDNINDRSLSGTKNTSATISRRRRSATWAASAPAPPGSAIPARGCASSAP
jgi:hypothetical protein